MRAYQRSPLLECLGKLAVREQMCQTVINKTSFGKTRGVEVVFSVNAFGYMNCMKNKWRARRIISEVQFGEVHSSLYCGLGSSVVELVKRNSIFDIHHGM